MAFYSGECRVCGEKFGHKGLTCHNPQPKCQHNVTHCFWCCELSLFGGIPNHGNFEIIFTKHKAAPTAENLGPVTMFHDA